MRASSSRRVRNAAQITAGVLLLATPVATAATQGGPSAHARTPALRTGDGALTAGRTAGVMRARARFAVQRRPRYAPVGRSIGLPGHLHAAGDHAPITLQQRQGRRWIRVSRGHTGPHGGFTLHYRLRDNRRVALRVHFSGSRTARPTSALLGDAIGLEPAVASWYYDNAGGTACGFHAAYGVAHKTLPCGARVTFRYGGRVVTATVDDRGPYVAGRSWDLGISTARALGLQGVQTVQASQ